jgi:UDP-N-acetylbacillosamine N-acetyltransferase
MTKTPIVIWGASGHALAVSNVAILCGQYEIAGYLDSVNPDKKGEIFNGKPVLGGLEALPSLKQANINHIALGFGHCKARVELAEMLKKNNFKIATLIHPTAVIAENVEIGEGTVILAGAIIDPECQIGRYAVINNGAIVNHGSIISDGVHVCPGVSLGGNVNIEICSWIGIGSCVIERIVIGEGSFIGAGSVVTKNIPAGSLAYGNPARVIRKVSEPF